MDKGQRLVDNGLTVGMGTAGENPVRRLMDKGLMVTLNGDDPAYFFGHKDRYGMEHGGYVISNYLVVARECALTADELVKLVLLPTMRCEINCVPGTVCTEAGVKCV
eukprot:3906108-Rhodomonas_salina.1